MRQGLFAVKLCELDRQYAHLRRRLEICQRESHEDVRREIRELERACDEGELMLEQSSKGCRTSAVSAMARAQLEYERQTRAELERMLKAPGDEESAAEGMTLYAEFAVDFAAAAANRALLTALHAIDLQMDAEEQRRKACE